MPDESLCEGCGLPLDPEMRRRAWPKGVSVQTCWECPDCRLTAWGVPDFTERELTIGDLFRLGEEARKRG